MSLASAAPSGAQQSTARRTQNVLLAVLVLGIPTLAQAQSTDPLQGFDHAAVRAAESAGVGTGDELATQVLLRQTQDARGICNQLVDDVNGLAALWEQVRLDALDRETFSFELRDARSRQSLHDAECRVGYSKLPQPTATTTLALIWEVEQIKGVWEPLDTLAQAWLNGAPRSEIDGAAALYRERLTAYGSWLDAHAFFWAGEWLQPEQSRTCVDDVRQASLELASQIRVQMVVPPADRSEADLRPLQSRIKGIENSVDGDCGGATLSPLKRVELDLLREQLRAYGAAISALLVSDPAALEAAMEQEQALTGRLMRCRSEHKTQGSVTPICKPSLAGPE